MVLRPSLPLLLPILILSSLFFALADAFIVRVPPPVLPLEVRSSAGTLFSPRNTFRGTELQRPRRRRQMNQKEHGGGSILAPPPVTSTRRDAVSSSDDNPKEDEGDNNLDQRNSVLPDQFNPFDYNRRSGRAMTTGQPTTTASSSSPTSSFSATSSRRQQRDNDSSGNTSRSVISLRKVRMSEISQDLLRVVASDSERMDRILKDNAEFLLEPLEDDDAVLDPDSIYSTDMDRSGRYEAYRTSMEERIKNARNRDVRKVLTALRDFVLSHE